MKKVVRCSALAIRFYTKDGWTLEELKEIAPHGEPVCSFPDDKDPYFVFSNECRVDIDRLIECVSEVKRYPGDSPGVNKNDRDYLMAYL
jgi:hypothetical protein